MIYIGLDMSLSSPGITIYNKKWYFYFFAQRKRELDVEEEKDNYYIKSIEYLEWKTREERVDFVSEKIINILYDHIVDIDLYENEYIIGIEGYSFGSQSRSVTGLSELGGVIRNKIYKRKWKYQEIPPGTIKKHFTGKGNANKYLLQTYFKNENIIDLYETCNFPEGIYDSVPSPVSDIIDATAIVYYLMGKNPKKANVIKNILKGMKK